MNICLKPIAQYTDPVHQHPLVLAHDTLDVPVRYRRLR